MPQTSKISNTLWKRIIRRCCCHCTSIEPIDEFPRVVPATSPPQQTQLPRAQVKKDEKDGQNQKNETADTEAENNQTVLTVTMQRLSSVFTKNSFTTGQSNGYHNAPESPSSYFGGSTHTRVRSMNLSSLRGKSEKTTTVRDTAMALKRKSAAALGAGISDTADGVGFIQLVEWIRTERLQTLPHKGSKWDTVLIRALYFAERLHGFETALTGHALDVEPASQIGYGHIRLLLEVRYSHTAARKEDTLMQKSSVMRTRKLLIGLSVYFTDVRQRSLASSLVPRSSRSLRRSMNSYA